MIWISSEKEVWRLHKKTVIYLKSVLRQPAQSLLLLLLIGLLSAAFTTRTVEYILVQRETARLGGLLSRDWLPSEHQSRRIQLCGRRKPHCGQ